MSQGAKVPSWQPIAETRLPDSGSVPLGCGFMTQLESSGVPEHPGVEEAPNELTREVGQPPRSGAHAWRVLRNPRTLILIAIIVSGIAVIGIGVAPWIYYREYNAETLVYSGLGLAIFAGYLLAKPGASGPSARDRVEDSVSLTPGLRLQENHVEGDLHISFAPSQGTSDSLANNALARSSEAIIKQEAILREIYYQGLEQARLSFRVSMWFASIGAGLLLTGVGLAILRASTNGDQYASAVTALSGSVITLTSSLFFVQANSTRKTMGAQGASLREESRDDRRFNMAREVALAVDDGARRDELKVQIALRLISDTTDLGSGPTPTSQSPSAPS